jgi:probable rRNA maturation factor
MLNLENMTDFKIDVDFLEKIIKYLKVESEVELIVSDSSYIQNLNREFRGLNRETDVLSFPLESEGVLGMPLGSIVISIDRVEQVSRELNHSKDEEFALLFIHGLLHLLGYDHEQDSGQMRELEIEIIREFNLPDSLIVRSS